MTAELKLLEELVGLDTNSVEKTNYEQMSRLLKSKLEEIGAMTDLVNSGCS